MAERHDAAAPWTEILEEIRSLRAEAARREDELWEAVDEIRALLASQRGGSGQAAGGTPAVRTPGRLDPAVYRKLKRRLRRLIAGALPAGGRVAVVSRGDEDLLDLPGCVTEHFPRHPDGGWLGFYPGDGIAAIAHFEWVRAEGAEYLLFPDTARWWLEEMPRFAEHLRARGSVLAAEEGVGELYALHAHARDADTWPHRLGALLDQWEAHTGSSTSVLDWDTGLELSAHLPGRTVFTPPRREATLPYLDGTVDVVAVTAAAGPTTLDEARRVARRSVVHLGSAGGKGAVAEPVPSIEHLHGAPSPLPVASIVVPTFNGIRHLAPCLRALDETLPEDFAGEVLVVDDASEEETARALDRLEGSYPWLRVIHNQRNAGFITSCNRGAAVAREDYLVFLNDDTIPLTGWLGALLGTFRSHPDAGAVGGRLVYPDTRLQEAGGLIFSDGTGANFGRGDYDLDAPLYRHVRRVHYCSGALLATPRRLFEELGGFDVRYRPAYYEDTDYCFSVRRSGLEVYYQPDATVVHVEGASSGTDVTSGVKRFQVRNRRIFRKKWEEELRALAPPPGSYSSHTWHRLAFHGDVR